jgi:hypothetical protein
VLKGIVRLTRAYRVVGRSEAHQPLRGGHPGKTDAAGGSRAAAWAAARALGVAQEGRSGGVALRRAGIGKSRILTALLWRKRALAARAIANALRMLFAHLKRIRSPEIARTARSSVRVHARSVAQNLRRLSKRVARPPPAAAACAA